jgi:hypothetical protein
MPVKASTHALEMGGCNRSVEDPFGISAIPLQQINTSET